MKFLDKLRGVKSSADYDAALVEVNASLTEAKGRLASLREALRSAPFTSSEDEVKALRQRIRDVEDEVEFAETVATETIRRRNEAAEVERTEEVKARMAAARKDWDRMIRLWGEYDRLVAAVEGPLDELLKLQSSVEEANHYAVAEGRSDLALRVLSGHAFGQIRQLIQQLEQLSRSKGYQSLVETGRITMPRGVPGYENGQWGDQA